MASKGCWWLYIIKTEKEKLYTGITTDIERRFSEHVNDPVKGAKFFRSDRPKAVVFKKQCMDRKEASIIERKIKKMSRKEKLLLINKGLFAD